MNYVSAYKKALILLNMRQHMSVNDINLNFLNNILEGMKGCGFGFILKNQCVFHIIEILEVILKNLFN
ncbi:hypothetical protein SASC256_18370 [Staphylococcus argenteus]|nr:hypothetical protein SA19061_14490 [Staphylococcus argenteus]GJF54785.1 hypothetical protein SA19088_15280 [Staphylococcus argenteus]GJF59811.1 hypothetical protein SA19105_12990 [Staphylococcus argenteus]GJF72929.1 hypothetical protein SA19202_15370 [Staphylococcus argenteus]GJF85817.1 hypothetical protein SA20015_15260 [Staphylococcus argenteus]